MSITSNNQDIEKHLAKYRRIAYKRANGSCCTSRNLYIAGKYYTKAAELYSELDQYESSAIYWQRAAQCFYEDDPEHCEASEAYTEAAKMYELADIYDAKTKALLCWIRAYQYGQLAKLSPRRLNEYILCQIRLVNGDKYKYKMYKMIKSTLDETGVHTISELEQYYSVIVFLAGFYRYADNHNEMHSALDSLKTMLVESNQTDEIQKFYVYHVILDLYVKDIVHAESVIQSYSKQENVSDSIMNLIQDLLSTFKSGDVKAFEQLLSSNRIYLRNEEIKQVAAKVMYEEEEVRVEDVDEEDQIKQALESEVRDSDSSSESDGDSTIEGEALSSSSETESKLR